MSVLRTISVDEMVRDLDELLRLVGEGESVQIAVDGTPVAILCPPRAAAPTSYVEPEMGD